jgi:multisubunit Na+/H+ antiporter MnhF subunit
MAEPHPVASDQLPAFITAPGETDVAMVVMGLFLVLAVVMFGVLFLRLHSLPDQIAHKSHKLQAEIVGVLCLIALFTHMHIFWVAALLLAMIDLPDFGTSLGRIADSTETLAGKKPREDAAEMAPTTMAHVRQTDVPVVPRDGVAGASAVRMLLRGAHSWARGIFAALERWWRRVYSSVAGRQAREGAAKLPPETMAGVKQADAHDTWPEKHGDAKQGNGAVSPESDVPQESQSDRPAPVPLPHVKGS